MTELVIKIDEETYKKVIDRTEFDTLSLGITLIEAVQNGTPLPKGHGRLKDVDWIDDNCPDYRTENGAWCYKWEDIDSAPTIIEADKAESEDEE